MFYNRLDSFVLRWEKRLSPTGLNLLAAILLLLAAAIYVRPELNYTHGGLWFEQLAQNPFDSSYNLLAYRILTPLISYLVGLRGQLFIVTNLIFAAIFIGSVYRYYRQTAPRLGDALSASLVLTFSTVVLITIGYSGFCDILTYLAIFSMWRWRRSVLLFTLFFAIALFNHENVLFLYPWLFLIRLVEQPRKIRVALGTVAGTAVVLAAYWLFRSMVDSERVVGQSLDFYLDPIVKDPLHLVRGTIQFYWLAWFSVFKALWLVPAAACYYLWKAGNRTQAFLVALPVALASAQLLIAWDSTRLFTLGFMSMVLALDYFFQSSKHDIRRWLPGLVALNLLIPQLFTAANVIEVMRSTPMNLLRMVLENKPWWP